MEKALAPPGSPLVGPTAGVDPESYIHSKYIVIWACNSVSTNLHHWAIVQDAKKKGQVVVLIRTNLGLQSRPTVHSPKPELMVH